TSMRTAIAAPPMPSLGRCGRISRATSSSTAWSRGAACALAIPAAAMAAKIAQLIDLDIRRLDDRRPAFDLALDQGEQRRLAAPRFIRNVKRDLGQALARIGVVKRLIERVGELVEDRLGGRPWGEQAKPGRDLEFREAGLLGRR